MSRSKRRDRPPACVRTTLIVKSKGILPMSIGKLKPPIIKRTPMLTP